MQGVQRTFLFVDTNEHAYGSTSTTSAADPSHPAEAVVYVLRLVRAPHSVSQFICQLPLSASKLNLCAPGGFLVQQAARVRGRRRCNAEPKGGAASLLEACVANSKV